MTSCNDGRTGEERCFVAEGRYDTTRQWWGGCALKTWPLVRDSTGDCANVQVLNAYALPATKTKGPSTGERLNLVCWFPTLHDLRSRCRTLDIQQRQDAQPLLQHNKHNVIGNEEKCRHAMQHTSDKRSPSC